MPTDPSTANHDSGPEPTSSAKNNNNQPSSSTSTTTDMRPLRLDPTRVSHLSSNLVSIRQRITSALPTPNPTTPPRLVAVSKLKPLTDILSLLTAPADKLDGGSPQTHFGENYVQELQEKAKLCWEYDREGQDGGKEKKVGRRVKWHFIGGLQSNKAASLARDTPGLWCVESLDSVKKARGLERGWGEKKWKWPDAGEKEEVEGEDEGGNNKLRVMIQVNTSGEENKSGVDPESRELVELARCVLDECQGLRLQGLMTIGAIARSQAAKEGEENEDFVKLKEVRGWLVRELGWGEGEEVEGRLELSMGMSEDFESAVRLGSGEVRVGSTIFGERPAKDDAKVV